MIKRMSIGMAVLLVIVAAGCKEKDKYMLRFSHVLHVKDNSMACADCHGEIKDGRLAKTSHETCNSCHDDIMKTNNISVKTCGVCHKEKNLQEIPKYAKPAVKTSSVFVHTPALKKECASCHEGTVSSKKDFVDKLSRGDKIAIRNKAHEAGKSCDECHINMSTLVAPADHDRKDWTRRHGVVSDDPDAVCGVCHSEDTCRACHQVNKPSSHNNLWRMKTHGIAASWERAKCQVCHEEDSCVSCHSEMRPRSHNASWKKRHCDQCHGSLSSGTGCETCHRNGLEAHPNPHAAGFRSSHCKSCHLGSPEVNQCILCHKEGLAGHPNPHAGNYRSTHCKSCHSGTMESEQCGICHPGGVAAHKNPHPAGWRSSHCNSCHSGTPEAEQCMLCHTEGLAGHPNPHAAGWRTSHCNSCHAGSMDECSVCHGSISGHPNPHAAGWNKTHCNSCHFGGGNTPDCQLCHAPGHTMPHDSLWMGQHCVSCHDSGPADCLACHVSGSVVEIHDARWPAFHTAGGYNEGTDCFDEGCHGGAGKKKMRKTQGVLRKPSAFQRLPARPRK